MGLIFLLVWLNYLNCLLRLLLAVALLVLFRFAPVSAQELEPRQLSNVPVGMKFIGVGAGHSRGQLLLDSAIPIDDFQSRIYSTAIAYVQAISFFGMSAKVDALIPIVRGHWSAIYEGEPATRDRFGMADPRLRLSVNFLGSPALSLPEFILYRPKTVVGLSVQVIAPLGQYDKTSLLNLSSNRWTIKTQLGISHTFNKWIAEAYASVWIFTDNDDFFGGRYVDQEPLFTATAHLIRILNGGKWIGVDVGYGYGGKSIVDSVPATGQLDAFRFGIVFSMPLTATHAMKFSYSSSFRIERGPDYDAYAVAWVYRWGGGM